jgi:spore coat polysaccharide biosynthesis predicted glycosyltransferase SpsG
MNTVPDWLFLCDGNDRSGLGHVGRCLGYAEMLADVGRSCVFQGVYGPAAACMIASAGFHIQASAGVSDMCQRREWPRLPAQGILVDSYDVTADNFTLLRSHLGPQGRLLVLDDFAAHAQYDCDGLINFTLGAADRLYPTGPARQHLGLGFFPVRRWLQRVREVAIRQDPVTNIRRVLVAAGGRDVNGVIPAFLALLASLGRDLQLGVLVGDDKVARASVEAWLPPRGSVEIIERQPDLEQWLGWADACLCGGGLMKYECLYAGVPVLALAQNAGQAEDSARMAGEGLIFDLGDVTDFSLETGLPVLKRFFDDAEARADGVRRGLSRVGGVSGMDGLLPFLA